MAIKGVALTVTYTAWDTAGNIGKTGDAANHTLRLIRDGTVSAPTNAPAEADAVNVPGEYTLALTAAEMTCGFLGLAGTSSTTGVRIVPVKVVTEQGSLQAIDDYVDELETRLPATLPELASVPAASPTLAQAVMLLYMALRNQMTASATEQKIRSDGGAVIGTAALSDDGTTFTRGKLA